MQCELACGGEHGVNGSGALRRGDDCDAWQAEGGTAAWLQPRKEAADRGQPRVVDRWCPG